MELILELALEILCAIARYTHFYRVILILPPPPRMCYFRMIVLHTAISVQGMIINVLFPDLFSEPALAHTHMSVICIFLGLLCILHDHCLSHSLLEAFRKHFVIFAPLIYLV